LLGLMPLVARGTVSLLCWLRLRRRGARTWGKASLPLSRDSRIWAGLLARAGWLSAAESDT